LTLSEQHYFFGTPPLKAQIDKISWKFGGHGPLGPLGYAYVWIALKEIIK